jgi:hypothetical protein
MNYSKNYFPALLAKKINSSNPSVNSTDRLPIMVNEEEK